MIQKLIQPKYKGMVSVEEAIFLRRSVRNFKDVKINEEKLSQILWSAYGVTERINNFRSIPSAGATYPLEIYFINYEGLYYYYPKDHSIEIIKKGDLRKQLSNLCLNQNFVSKASLCIIICAVYERTTIYYGQRGLRYVYFEVGHCAQNVCLQTVALGLNSVCIGAFDDKEIKKLLSYPENLEPLYIIAIGEKL